MEINAIDPLQNVQFSINSDIIEEQINYIFNGGDQSYTIDLNEISNDFISFYTITDMPN